MPIFQLQSSDIRKMSSGDVTEVLGIIPEDRIYWNRFVHQSLHLSINCVKMRDMYQSLQWTEIPAADSNALRSVMTEVLQSELGLKYFPTIDIHQNYYELLKQKLYWQCLRQRRRCSSPTMKDRREREQDPIEKPTPDIRENSASRPTTRSRWRTLIDSRCFK